MSSAPQTASILTSGEQFIYDCDNQLYARRWETIISNRDSVDIVQLLTWNDFGESHYLGPIHGNLPPGADAWTDGFDHTGAICFSASGATGALTPLPASAGFLEITSYFATWFKTGEQPTVAQDQLLMWARPHPKDAVANDTLSPPTNYELVRTVLSF